MPKWFEGPAIMVIDWARPRTPCEIKTLEAAASELLKWPKSEKRDIAAKLINQALKGETSMEKAEKAFMEAASHAEVFLTRVW